MKMLGDLQSSIEEKTFLCASKMESNAQAIKEHKFIRKLFEMKNLCEDAACQRRNQRS